jgi:hypothetical protein
MCVCGWGGCWVRWLESVVELGGRAKRPEEPTDTSPPVLSARGRGWGQMSCLDGDGEGL